MLMCRIVQTGVAGGQGCCASVGYLTALHGFGTIPRMSNTTEVDEVTPDLRLRRILGALPAIAIPRMPNRDATLDEILTILEASIEGNQRVLAEYERDRQELNALRSDVAAFRRVLGVSA